MSSLTYIHTQHTHNNCCCCRLQVSGSTKTSFQLNQPASEVKLKRQRRQKLTNNKRARARAATAPVITHLAAGCWTQMYSSKWEEKSRQYMYPSVPWKRLNYSLWHWQRYFISICSEMSSSIIVAGTFAHLVTHFLLLSPVCERRVNLNSCNLFTWVQLLKS